MCLTYKNIFDKPFDKRIKPSQEFYNDFLSNLALEGSFDYPFDSLKNIGKIYSPDKRLRIYTWNIPTGISENLYFGIIQYHTKSGEQDILLPLNRSDSLNFRIDDNVWRGALYYKVIETRHVSQNYYTLLGFDPGSYLTNKKVIEVISIDNFNELYFCKKVLQYEGQMVDRIVFEYNEKAVMSLQYNDNMKMIVFDHLSPSKPSLKGQYEFYGPDFTYDGLKWEKGIWVYYSNIEITN
jgi:hypothetical protein